MNNLFSVFDPKSLCDLPLNWVSILLIFVFSPSLFWKTHSQSITSFFALIKSMTKEFTAVISATNPPGMVFILIALFLFLCANNILGLLPYTFTATSHPMMTLTLGISLWLGYNLQAWGSNFTPMFSHLVPSGSPLALAPFMVVIEIISTFIRPLALAIRLAANMLAGHLLMVLVSSPLTSSSLNHMFVLTLLALVLLAVLESAVALIQAYVFSILSSLYIKEVLFPNSLT